MSLGKKLALAQQLIVNTIFIGLIPSQWFFFHFLALLKTGKFKTGKWEVKVSYPYPGKFGKQRKKRRRIYVWEYFNYSHTYIRLKHNIRYQFSKHKLSKTLRTWKLEYFNSTNKYGKCSNINYYIIYFLKVAE